MSTPTYRFGHLVQQFLQRRSEHDTGAKGLSSQHSERYTVYDAVRWAWARKAPGIG